MTIDQDIQRISSLIELMSKHYFETRDMLLADGEIDDVDQIELDDLANRLNAARARVDTLIAQQTGAAVPGSEDETVERGNTPNLTRFDANRGDFITQILAWKNSVNIALNDIANAASNITETSSFPRGDIVSLAATALSTIGQPQIATAIGVANTLLNIALDAYERSLPPTPSVRLIQTEWRNALNVIDSANAGDVFDQLVDVFRNYHDIDSAQVFVPASHYELWMELREEFRGGRLLPAETHISRAFMTYFIRNMLDNTEDEDMAVGEVTVEMEYDTDRSAFTFSSGSVDNITPQVRSGLTDNAAFFGPGGVISLPATIRFRISGTGMFDGRYCEFLRVSTASGGIDFRLIRDPGSDLSVVQQEGLLTQFMGQRVYLRVSVNEVL